MLSSGPSGKSIVGAPAAVCFEDCWAALAQGSRPSSGVKDVGQRESVNKLQWCLWEALKMQQRVVLQQAAVIGLVRDERKGRLLVRFRAVDDKGRSHKGVLGQAKGFGTGAENICKATKQIMRDFMAPNFRPPRSCAAVVAEAASEPEPGLKETCKKIFEKVEFLTVDSASDELLSAELMRQSIMDDEEERQRLALTPNLKLVIRDTTHASRRTRA